jgi:hypothetical protein
VTSATKEEREEAQVAAWRQRGAFDAYMMMHIRNPSAELEGAVRGAYFRLLELEHDLYNLVVPWRLKF